jgi:anti-sigma regulatory factor (Ser/Thr protein kinase)/Fe-S-cluster-containing hydrogenase component 2
MTSNTYSISGGDFQKAGAATSRLKEQLKRIGVEQETVRRAVIAAYEAEMNVVIHAWKGNMRVMLDDGQIDVEVTDAGPGIPDMDRAMQEGFSTASPQAIELGFGAGMGLPNIKKNSDLFDIASTVGKGTRVYFRLCMVPQDACVYAGNSVRVSAELCRECLHCLRICPTQALRVRNGKPEVLDHLCIDCGACIRVCKTGALSMIGKADVPRPTDDTVLIVPSAFLVQFGAHSSPHEVLAGLAGLGFRDVRVTEGWEDALREAVMEYASEETASRPVISPVCPAVVNLIEMRFPSLMANLAPFLSPVEAMCEEFAGHPIVLLAACPSQSTSIMSNTHKSNIRIVVPTSLRRALLPLVRRASNATAGVSDEHYIPVACRDEAILQVSGIDHVMAVLEKAEDGALNDIDLMEPYACSQGCFGSPFFSEDCFVARHRRLELLGSFDTTARAVRRRVPYAVRAGLRLDEDMSRAITKLSKIDELAKSLPGKDCAMCGAPTCGSFAEDVVLGRATESVCVHLNGNESEAA